MGLSGGTRFGPYEIVEPIGAGGMGEVYRARDTRPAHETIQDQFRVVLNFSTEIQRRTSQGAGK